MCAGGGGGTACVTKVISSSKLCNIHSFRYSGAQPVEGVIQDVGVWPGEGVIRDVGVWPGEGVIQD
jgi:hypothetical protein